MSAAGRDEGAAQKGQVVIRADAGQQADRRRRRLMTGVGVVLILSVLTVAGSYWRSAARRIKSPLVPVKLPVNINQQLSGYSFTRSEGGRQVFTIHAARTLAFKQGGQTSLEDVLVEVFGRLGNRRDVLETGRCEYNPATGELFAPERVTIRLNAGAPHSADAAGPQVVTLDTSRVQFSAKGSRLETDEPVRIRVGNATGSAKGLVYSTREDSVELKKNFLAEVPVRAGRQGDVLLHLAAASARYTKRTGSIELSGPVEITGAESRIAAARATVLLDENERVREIRLSDGVKVADRARHLDASMGEVFATFDKAGRELREITGESNVVASRRGGARIFDLRADGFGLALTGKQPRPSAGTASGNVQLEAEPAQAQAAGRGARPSSLTVGAGTDRLEADGFKYDFTEGTWNLKHAETVGPGKLVFTPQDPKSGQRVVTGEPLVMLFDSKGRLERLRAPSKAKIVFAPPATAPPGSPSQVSASDTLEAVFEPESADLETVEQAGNFHFQDGEREASADRARYDAASQILTLDGHPLIWDSETRMQASRVSIDVSTGIARGFDGVQATHAEPQGKAPGAPAPDPVNVVAQQMTAERNSGVVRYVGHVRVWHGGDVLESESMDVDRTKRRLSTDSPVLTSHLQPASPAGKSSPKAGTEGQLGPLSISANRLEYFDEGRRAVYRGKVELKTEDTRMTADRLEVSFRQAQGGEAEIDRAVADGAVKVVQRDRRASGEHAEYLAGEGKIRLTGGPPALSDAEGNSTTARSLTFFLRDDTVITDGDAESPTISKHSMPR